VPPSSAPQAQLTISRETVRPSMCMCVVHGMHGSKLRIARSTSMPLKSSGFS
jgi:hypothetical protein